MLVFTAVMLYNKINYCILEWYVLLFDLLTSKSYTIADIILGLVSSLCVIFITLPIHEFAHGFVATKLGDYTPRMQGRLTLNPMAHIDYMGALGILLFGIGWARPVQVNARNFKNPKWGMALTAIAGPASNVLVAFIAIVCMYGCAFFVDSPDDMAFYLYLFFVFLARMNVYLAVFNLIPVPPFDGSRVLFSFLPTKYYFAIMRYERYIFILLFALIFTGVLDTPLDFVTTAILNGLGNIVGSIFGLFV